MRGLFCYSSENLESFNVVILSEAKDPAGVPMKSERPAKKVVGRPPTLGRSPPTRFFLQLFVGVRMTFRRALAPGSTYYLQLQINFFSQNPLQFFPRHGSYFFYFMPAFADNHFSVVGRIGDNVRFYV